MGVWAGGIVWGLRSQDPEGGGGVQMGGPFLGPLSPLRAPPRRLLTRGCLPCVPTVASEMSLRRWTRAQRPHWKRGP